MTGHADPALAPSAWVRRHLALIPAGGHVLDVAAGGGRHTRLARAAGHTVTAVDRDLAGLADLAGDDGVELVQADLESGPWPFAGEEFAGVIVTNYLHRPLFPHLAAAVAPEGALIYETFARGNEAFGKPSNPDFLLGENELLAAFARDLTIVAYEHGRVASPRPAVVQRLAARRSPSPAPLG
jgi:SAM-dependent methyltransferase